MSESIYASLNCGPGSNDDAEAVAENRQLVQQALGGASLSTLYQIHSAEVVVLTQPWTQSSQADAIVTTQPNRVIGVLTADCGPVLFADAEAGVIAAAHAGWKGARAGILQNTIAVMVQQGAKRERICAALGPCIAQASYEVGAQMRLQFDAADHDLFDTNDSGKFQFDLSGYILRQLEHEKLGSVEGLGIDTYINEQRYFSYRRTTHAGEPDYGRQISAIVLKG